MLGHVSLAYQNARITCEPNVIDNHVTDYPLIAISGSDSMAACGSTASIFGHR